MPNGFIPPEPKVIQVIAKSIEHATWQDYVGLFILELRRAIFSRVFRAANVITFIAVVAFGSFSAVNIGPFSSWTWQAAIFFSVLWLVYLAFTASFSMWKNSAVWFEENGHCIANREMSHRRSKVENSETPDQINAKAHIRNCAKTMALALVELRNISNFAVQYQFSGAADHLFRNKIHRAISIAIFDGRQIFSGTDFDIDSEIQDLKSEITTRATPLVKIEEAFVESKKKFNEINADVQHLLQSISIPNTEEFEGALKRLEQQNENLMASTQALLQNEIFEYILQCKDIVAETHSFRK